MFEALHDSNSMSMWLTLLQWYGLCKDWIDTGQTGEQKKDRKRWGFYRLPDAKPKFCFSFFSSNWGLEHLCEFSKAMIFSWLRKDTHGVTPKNGSLKFEMIHKWFMIEERRQNSQTVQDFKIGDWDGEDSAQLWGEFRLRAKKTMRETWMHGRSFAESCFSWESTHGETSINISFLDQASACPRVRVENNQHKHRLHQNS